MKLGACTVTYLDYTTLEEAIKRIAKFGYDGVDIWADSPHLDPLYGNSVYRKGVKKLIKRCRLKVAGLSVNGAILARRYNFSHSEKWVRRDTVSYYKKCIDLAREMECPYVNMLSGHMVFGTTREEAWKWNRECMGEITRYAEKQGIIMALHSMVPMFSRVVVTLDDILQMAKEINSPNCKIMLDVSDIHLTESNISDAVRKAYPSLVYVHASDNNGKELAHLIPGEGTIDWHRFVRVLKEVKYDGYITVQVDPAYSVDPDEWVEKSLWYLQKVLRDCRVKS